jgi:hypothetical protein
MHRRLRDLMPALPGFRWFSGRRIIGSSVLLSVVTSTARRGVLAGTLASGELSSDTLFPFLGSISSQESGRIPVWFYEDDQGKVPRGNIGLNPRGQRRLKVATDGPPVSVELPQRFSVRVRTPPAMDLPPGASIHVGPELFGALRRHKWSRVYALLTTGERVSLPVRLYQRSIGSEYVLAPLSLRTLCGITESSKIQLAKLPWFTPWERRSRLTGRVFKRQPDRRWARETGLILGIVIICIRIVDVVVEQLMRVALRSPPLSFRVIQANPGDDDLRDTIRLHPVAFAALALKPGGQVILNWAGQRMAVRALEDQSPVDTPVSTAVLQSIGLRLDTGLLPEDFPAHLVIRIPAPIRTALNIPPSTVIQVRRRLRPAVVSQLNQLTIPVAGLVVAAAAIPAVRGWPLVVGSIAAVVLGLAPLRSPRPPRGHWP